MLLSHPTLVTIESNYYNTKKMSEYYLLCAYLFLEMKVKVLVALSCPALYNPACCSPPGSSVPEFLQVRVLEWVAIPFSRGSSWPRDGTPVSLIVDRFFTIWATREALCGDWAPELLWLPGNNTKSSALCIILCGTLRDCYGIKRSSKAF